MISNAKYQVFCKVLSYIKKVNKDTNRDLSLKERQLENKTVLTSIDQ